MATGYREVAISDGRKLNLTGSFWKVLWQPGLKWPSPHKLHPHLLWNHPCLIPPVEQHLDRAAPAWAVVHRPLVHVHPDERVGPFVADPTVVLPGMSQG